MISKLISIVLVIGIFMPLEIFAFPVNHTTINQTLQNFTTHPIDFQLPISLLLVFMVIIIIVSIFKLTNFSLQTFKNLMSRIYEFCDKLNIDIILLILSKLTQLFPTSINQINFTKNFFDYIKILKGIVSYFALQPALAGFLITLCLFYCIYKIV